MHKITATERDKCRLEPQGNHRTFRINFYGYFFLARAAVPRMKKGSCIINTGSITGLEGAKDLLDYSATMGAIHAFTKSLAQNPVEKGNRVSNIDSSYISGDVLPVLGGQTIAG
jgi:NAD(P)-dependent dehydrogenase (short-subunit alcohol dehydrogenase family)